MIRFLYSLLWYLAAPLIGFRLLWRSFRQPAYLLHLAERFGFYRHPVSLSPKPLIWLHAVSVGEIRAAEPLVKNLRENLPGYRILITCMTPTGREAAVKLYGEDIEGQLAYLPYDYPGAATRFLEHFQPSLGLLMETEIWPNLMAAAFSRHLPVILVNARLSRKSARGYARIAPLIYPALRALKAIAAQSRADARRFRALGASSLTVCGNIKFDMEPKPELLSLGQTWRHSIGNRPVWLAASTREGEETPLLDAYERLSSENLLLVLVPRHPQRFEEVARLIKKRGFSMERRSQNLPEKHHQIWLGDSMGEMAAYYQLSDWAFIGGSLLPLGGQNLIEAAVVGKPILIGEHTFNFEEASKQAVIAGAAWRVKSLDELTGSAKNLLENEATRKRMSEAAYSFTHAHRGAVQRTLAVILQQVLPSS